MFSKPTYWQRRTDRLRGQVEEVPPVTVFTEGSGMLIGRNVIPNNRAYRRKRVYDRLFTKRGYRLGEKIK